jgi:hypothetical protein
LVPQNLKDVLANRCASMYRQILHDWGRIVITTKSKTMAQKIFLEMTEARSMSVSDKFKRMERLFKNI